MCIVLKLNIINQIDMMYDFLKFINMLLCYRIKGSTTINYLSIFDISSKLVQNYFYNVFIL